MTPLSPLSPLPPPLSEPQLAAAAKVACSVVAGNGVAILCGPPGVGKTTVLHHLAGDSRLTNRAAGVRDVAGWLDLEGDLPGIVLVDDAHLSGEVELACLLARVQMARPQAAMVLAGEGRLLTLVARERRLEQAIQIRVALLPGSLADSRGLLGRCRDGERGPSLDEPAMATLHEIAAGIPADVLRLGDLAGVVAASRADGRISVDDIEAIHRRLSPHAA